jgi:tRNA G10  N-methylase Trm11
MENNIISLNRYKNNIKEETKQIKQKKQKYKSYLEYKENEKEKIEFNKSEIECLLDLFNTRIEFYKELSEEIFKENNFEREELRYFQYAEWRFYNETINNIDKLKKLELIFKNKIETKYVMLHYKDVSFICSEIHFETFGADDIEQKNMQKYKSINKKLDKILMGDGKPLIL